MRRFEVGFDSCPCLLPIRNLRIGLVHMAITKYGRTCAESSCLRVRPLAAFDHQNVKIRTAMQGKAHGNASKTVAVSAGIARIPPIIGLQSYTCEHNKPTVKSSYIVTLQRDPLRHRASSSQRRLVWSFRPRVRRKVSLGLQERRL